MNRLAVADGHVYILHRDGTVTKDFIPLYDGYTGGVGIAAYNDSVYVLTQKGVVWKDDSILYEGYSSCDMAVGAGGVFVLTLHGRVFCDDEQVDNGFGPFAIAATSDDEDFYVLTQKGTVYRRSEELFQDYNPEGLAVGGGNIYVLTQRGCVYKNDERLIERDDIHSIAADEKGNLFILTDNFDVLLVEEHGDVVAVQ